VASVSAGVANTCAVLTNAAVECWGSNVDGQLGNGAHTVSARPVRVSLQGNAIGVAVGLAHACALMQGGVVQCWGSNANGQLGDGKTVDSPVPVRVEGLSGFATAIAAGDAHTCALLRSGRIQCWGWNVEGQLGDGTGADSSTPVPVIGIARAHSIAAAGSDTCAIVGRGSVDCWGSNIYGQLGDGSTLDQIGPVTASGVGDAKAVVSGLAHTCAVTESGSVTCWGQGVFGQLGSRATVNSVTPVDVSGIGLAPDGSGQVGVSPDEVEVGLSGTTLVFSYRVAVGGLRDGGLTLTPPVGWSSPSLKETAQGYSTADHGVVDVAGGSINVRDLNLAGGSVVHVVYGSLDGHGPGAQTSGLGPQGWSVQEQSSLEGTLTSLAPRLVQVLPADGGGTLTPSTRTVGHGGAESVTFVYTAAKGGLRNGAISVLVPGGWSPPSATASAGAVAIVGRAIVVSGLRLKEGAKVTLTYRGAPPATDVGSQTWQASERSGASGTLMGLSSSPTISVLAPDGAGTLSTDTTVVSSASENTITFTYSPGDGDIRDGALTVVVPPGWSAPSIRAGAPGYVRASTGVVSVSGRRIQVELPKLPSAKSHDVKLLYGVKGHGGRGAKAPSVGADSEEWRALEQSSSTGRARALATPVLITVLAADGSGRLQRASSATQSGAQGQTVVFMYLVAAGGIGDGVLTLEVPAGWSPPSTDAHAPGFVTSSAGTVTVHGSVITISGLSLHSGAAVTIVYGNRAGDGPGAAAPNVVGPNLWPAAEQSSPHGKLRTLAR
jgi:hypothetical protein